MKKALLSLVLVLGAALAEAQEISVASFVMDETDLTANYPESTVYDQNGEKCALIKINTTQVGFTFDVGSLGVTKTENHPAQIWVYVPHGVRKISIFHQSLGSLINWYFPINIESAKTYLMRLTTAEVKVVVTNKSYMDYLVINVQPKDAIVYIDNEVLSVEDGVASKLLTFGTYNYRVEARGYHSQSGEVSVDDGKKEMFVSLKPAFGYLTIPSSVDLAGATVFIDGKQMTDTQFLKKQIPSGAHTLDIKKAFCRPFSIRFTIEDEKELIPAISLVPDYTMISVRTDPETEIFINDQSVGKGSWSGKLQSGAYRITGKKAHHRASVQEVVIKGMQDSQIVTLDPPTPIVGSANITSSPAGCKVEIDGQEVGQTPLYLQEKLLEGSHTVKFSKDKYLSVEKTILIEENKITACSVSLDNVAKVTVKITPEDAGVQLFIDGVPHSSSDIVKNFTLGEHEFFVEDSERFERFTMKVDVQDDKQINIALTEKTSYKKDQERLAREQFERDLAEKQRLEREARAKERADGRAPFKFGMGWDAVAASINAAGDHYCLTSNLLFSGGSIKNAFNFNAGIGYASMDNEQMFPLLFRVYWNLAHKRAKKLNGNIFCMPYLGAEIRYYIGANSNPITSFPIRFGLDIFHMRFDLIYEPCLQQNAENFGMIGLGFGFAFDNRTKR